MRRSVRLDDRSEGARRPRHATALAFLALAVSLVGVGAAPPARAAAPPAAVEAGLLEDRSAMLSLIVRLEGPSLAAARREDGAAAPGLAPEAARARLADRRAAMLARQAPAAAAIAATGATVVARYQALVNGFLVHASPAQVPAIARVPGVVSVAYAPLLAAPAAPAGPPAVAADADQAGATGAGPAGPVGPAPGEPPRPLTADSVPWIGAPRVWSELGWKGDNALVAVLDTGVDYTHAAFGGPGTEAAYANNNEDVVESGSFPTDRVVGGYDLAGRRYSPHPICGRPGVTDQNCSRSPRPDDDPLDARGNGTHVAGVVAGQRTAGLAEGVAPGARLVPLKIFGNPINSPAVTDLLVGAFDWVVNNNLDLPVPGFKTASVDVVLISLSDDWLSGATETERVIKEASDAGLVVVVAFGNQGPHPYLSSAAASAEYAVSVGSSYPPGEHALLYEAGWAGGGGAERREGMALDSQIVGQPDAFPAGFSGPAAWMGSACNDAPAEQPVSGKVALVLRGDCAFAEKMLNAQAAGAVAVTVYTTATLPVQPMGGQASLSIPGVMIDFAGGDAIRQALVAGRPVTLSVREPAQDLLADVQSAFANRGPSRVTAGVKPQLAGPGQYIVSAWPGAQVRSQTGTSMGAAHVAGTAALLAQRKKAKRLDVEAAELAALLINTASPTVRLERADIGALAPVTLQGAGRVDAWKAATANTIVRSSPGIAELSFGHVDVADQPLRLERTLYVHNLAATAKTYAPKLQLVKPEEDGDAGVSLAFDPPRLTVAAGKKANLKVSLTVDPAKVRPWSLEGREAVADAALLEVLQIDGWVILDEVDGGGAPVAGGDRPAIPFLVLPRRRSCVTSTTDTPFWLHAYGDNATQRWSNACDEPGVARISGLMGEDAEDAALPGALDIRRVGLRSYAVDPTDPESDVILELSVQTRGPRRVPADAEVRVYIDVDRDHVMDFVVWNAYAPEVASDLAPGRWVVMNGALAPGELDPVDSIVDPAAAIVYQPYSLDETVTRLLVSGEELGLDLRSEGELFDLVAAVVDRRGDYPPVGDGPAQDWLPDDFTAGGMTFDQLVYKCVTPQGQVTVPGRTALGITLTMVCDPPELDTPLALLLEYPGNAVGAGQAGVRAGKLATQPQTPTPEGFAVFLPVAHNR